MSENDSIQMFAYGAFSTDSPQFEQTCDCPLSVAFKRTFNEADEMELDVVQYYDNYCVDHFGTGYNFTEKGNISEEKAREAWKETIAAFHGVRERIAKDVATELGWDELAE
jgi:hypothetical protein